MGDPFRSAAPLCRACAGPMQLDGEIASCHICGGLWLPEAKLRRLYYDEAKDDLPEFLEHEDGRPTRSCPSCGERMQHVFLEMLELDRCADHGLWLNAGELERILEWRRGRKQPTELGFMFNPRPPVKPL